MIYAKISTFLRKLKVFKHASSNSMGTSLAKRFVSGLAMCEKTFYKTVVKTSMTKKTTNPFDIYGRR
jgi:hypothetical protein